MVDLAKLDAALSYIESHPAEWRQATWGLKEPCGTAYCLAGHVARIDGAEMTWEPLWFGDGSDLALIGGKDPGLYARESLRLDVDQAAQLFHATNSLTTLKRMRDALALNPNVSDDDLWEIAEEEGDR